MKILFLASNPLDTTHIRISEEIREIEDRIERFNFGEKFKIIPRGAVKIKALQGFLLQEKPNIVHFSGHGTQSHEIIFENELGESCPVSDQVLSNLFKELKENINCVILNPCYSEPQAVSIAQNIEYVIGMSDEISDLSSVSFSFAFYQALGFGKDIKTAFNLGCIQLELENSKDAKIPKLFRAKEWKKCSKTSY